MRWSRHAWQPGAILSPRESGDAMTEPSIPEVVCEQQHAALPVSDVLAAVSFYTNKLGFRLGFTWGEPPSMAGVNLGNVQMFLERGAPNPTGCSVYFVVGNADELYEFQRANGVDIASSRAIGRTDCATTGSAIWTGTSLGSGITCSTPGLR